MKQATKRNALDDVRSEQDAVLRIADAIEDAPYELESAKVIDIRLAASCSQDFETPGGYRAEPNKRRE